MKRILEDLLKSFYSVFIPFISFILYILDPYPLRLCLLTFFFRALLSTRRPDASLVWSNLVIYVSFSPGVPPFRRWTPYNPVLPNMRITHWCRVMNVS